MRAKIGLLRKSFRRAATGSFSAAALAAPRAAALAFILIAAARASEMGSKIAYVTAAPIDPITVNPGKGAKLEIDLRVNQGYHINSHHPSEEILLPTTLNLDLPTNISVANINYPPGKDATFPFLLPGDKLNVYTGDFSITALVKPAASVPPNTYRVHGLLKYQACDDRQCYPPREVPIEFDVHVVKPSKAHGLPNPGQSPHVHE